MTPQRQILLISALAIVGFFGLRAAKLCRGLAGCGLRAKRTQWRLPANFDQNVGDPCELARPLLVLGRDTQPLARRDRCRKLLPHRSGQFRARDEQA